MARSDEQPEQYGVAPVAGYARRTAINPVGKSERADRPDGLLGGRRHGGGNRSISEIPDELCFSQRKVLMSDTSQIALIRKLYDARGNVNIFKSLLADDLEYDIAEGFPTGASIAVSTRLLMISSHFLPTSTSSTRKGTSTSSRAIT